MTETYKLGWTWNPFTKRFEKMIGDTKCVLHIYNPFKGI